MAQQLSTIYMFKEYKTQKAWEEAHPGQKCPVFRPDRRPKYWEDIAVNSMDDYVFYPNVLAMTDAVPNYPAKDSNGNPYLKNLVLPAEEAALVNIPPDKISSDVKLRNAYQVPCKDIPTGLKLIFSESFAQGGTLGVVLKDPNEKPMQAIAFTQYHEDLMEAIARKVGVSEEVIK